MNTDNDQATFDTVDTSNQFDQQTTSSETVGNQNDEQNTNPSFDEAQSQNDEQVITEQQPEVDQEAIQRENNLKAERAKWAKLESENARLKKLEQEHQTYKQTIDSLNQAYQKSPKAWEALRQDLIAAGQDDIGAYETRFSAQTQQQVQNIQQNVFQSPEQIAAQVEQQLEMKLEKKQAFKAIIDEFPELAPKQGEDEYAKEEKIRKYSQMEIWAQDIKSWKPELSYQEALKEAYFMFPENREKYTKYRETIAENAGRAAANANNSTVTPPAGGAPRQNANTVAVSPEDERIMRALGLHRLPGARDEYLKHKSQK